VAEVRVREPVGYVMTVAERGSDERDPVVGGVREQYYPQRLRSSVELARHAGAAAAKHAVKQLARPSGKLRGHHRHQFFEHH
jgi:hypothetical protein